MAGRSPGDKLLSEAMIEFTGAIMRHSAPMRKAGKELGTLMNSYIHVRYINLICTHILTKILSISFSRYT